MTDWNNPDDREGAIAKKWADAESALTAANERNRKLEDNLYTTTAHYKCAALHRDQLMALLTAEREVSDKLETALNSIGEFRAGMGGNAAARHFMQTANTALAEVAAIRKGEKQ